MSKIKNKGTKPEETVRKHLYANGLRYRKNVRTLPGCPDIVLSRYRVAIFVHGCFWHMHDCGRFHWPETNRDFWRHKIQCNVERDKLNKEKLRSLGWKVLTVWECELQAKKIDETMGRILEEITMMQY